MKLHTAFGVHQSQQSTKSSLYASNHTLSQNMQQFYKTEVTVFVIKIVALDCSIYVLLIYEMQYVLCH